MAANMQSSDVALTDVATQPRKSIDLANRLRVHGGVPPSASVAHFEAETTGMRITFKVRLACLGSRTVEWSRRRLEEYGLAVLGARIAGGSRCLEEGTVDGVPPVLHTRLSTRAGSRYCSPGCAVRQQRGLAAQQCLGSHALRGRLSSGLVAPRKLPGIAPHPHRTPPGEVPQLHG